jgi:hypothetical protein
VPYYPNIVNPLLSERGKRNENLMVNLTRIAFGGTSGGGVKKKSKQSFEELCPRD